MKYLKGFDWGVLSERGLLVMIPLFVCIAVVSAAEPVFFTRHIEPHLPLLLQIVLPGIVAYDQIRFKQSKRNNGQDAA